MKEQKKMNDDELLNGFDAKECAKVVERNPCSNLLEALQYVLDASDGCGFEPAMYRLEAWADHAFDYVNARMGLTDVQSILLAIIFEEGATGRTADISDISSHVKCSKIEAVQQTVNLEELISRGIVEPRGRNDYYITDEAFDAFKNDEVYERGDTRCVSTDELLSELIGLHRACCEREFGAKTLSEKISNLMERNIHLDFVKRLQNLKEKLSEAEYRFLLAVSIDCVQGCDEGTSVWGRKWIFGNPDMQHVLLKSLHMGSSKLIKLNLLECSGSSGLAIRDMYVLTNKAKQIINPDWVEKPNGMGCIRHADIRPLKLYYNDTEAKQVKELLTLLKPANFCSIQKRLRKGGMRGGFNCLFYGAPGTGKTETVYQLAKATGRDVFKVDFSQMRDKYVGESEKKVKGVFDAYRKMAKGAERKPILLLNEADALITNRIGAPGRAVDKMENTLQNIILQEMEDLDGIMIATTNLAGSMDKAFERRFLYKVAFKKPETPVRAKIWKSLMPSLGVKDCEVLAKDYPDFAGGQIENISRKAVVSEALYGSRPSLERLKELCDSEMLVNKKQVRKIGF